MTKTEHYNAHGTVPHPYSTRVSWWPEDKSPDEVRKVADKLWPDRDPNVTWWLGCCGVAENYLGFPLFHDIRDCQIVGLYWFGLAFEAAGIDHRTREV